MWFERFGLKLKFILFFWIKLCLFIIIDRGKRLQQQSKWMSGNMKCDRNWNIRLNDWNDDIYFELICYIVIE